MEETEEKSDIVLVISDLGSGGAQKVLTTLANVWAQKGIPICVITLSSEENDFFLIHPSIQRRVIGGLRESQNLLEAIWMNGRRLWKLRQCLKKSGASTVVAFIGTTNMLTLFASMGLGIRIILSERNDPARQSLGKAWNFLRRWFYRYADCVTANSKGVIETLSQFVPREKLVYVPNPLGIRKEEVRVKKETKSILTVGRLHAQKGYDILLPAFAQIASRYPDWSLDIVGEGPLKETLQALARELDIETRVRWHGRTPDPFAFYNQADMFVLASRYEGTPNALLEAMSCGLPVIVTDASPGPLEFVEQKITGLIVPSEKIDSLACAMSCLIEQPDLRFQLGCKAHEKVKECELHRILPIWEQILGISRQTV